MKTLNLGCGNDPYGDVKVDMHDYSIKGIIKADINEKLPFKDGEFSEIRMYGVIENLHNVQNTLTECHRILCNSGRLDIRTNNIDSPRFIIGGLHGKPAANSINDNPPLLAGFNSHMLTNQLKLAGFRIDDIDSDLIRGSLQIIAVKI